MNEEVRRVVTILRKLARQVVSPVIRSCLEEARTDILYLAGEADEVANQPPDQAEAA